MNTPLSDAVLQQVNLIREKLGGPTLAELPPGSIKQAQSCPIANALSGSRPDGTTIGATVTNQGILITHHGEEDSKTVEMPLTNEMRAFISAFDRGLLKRYVTKKVKRAPKVA